MFLVPPDSSHSEAVFQIVRSLQIFQQNSNQILAKAAQRAGQCQERLGKLMARAEVLEAKLDVLDQMEQMPILHCAAKYPEVGTPGQQIPVFDRLNCATPFCQPSAPHFPPNRPIHSANDRQSVKEAFLRKQNIVPLYGPKMEPFNVEKLAKMLANSGECTKVDLSKLLEEIKRTEGQSAATAQIDFSESLLDDDSLPSCPSPSPQIDPFEFESAVELIEFDLPEDLPGMDAKSLGGTKSLGGSSAFQSSISIGQKGEKLQKSSESLKKEEKRKSNDALGPMGEERPSPMGMDISRECAALLANVSPPNPIPVSIPSNSSMPPAPPPPPPPPPPPQFAAAAKGQSGRADLMEAIRATGGMKGAGLKKVEKEKEGEKGGGKKMGAAAGEEDLMSSLAKVLALRRRGISGKEKTKSTGAKGALDSLRERIPIVKRGEEGEEEEWK